MSGIVPVILCGGSGARLWPLSREAYPKQFVDMGGGKTLFRDTLLRVQRTPWCAEPLVVCNEAHRFYVTAELYTCGLSGKIFLEPAPRNTAPAIALAAFALRQSDADPLMLVLPSDHVFDDEKAFFEGVECAVGLAEHGHIVAFGIAPTRPETGFGYIEQGEALGGDALRVLDVATQKTTDEDRWARELRRKEPAVAIRKPCKFGGGYRVARFAEKPDVDSAVAMLAKGGHLWNSGMFLMRSSVYLAELRRFAPAIYAACHAAWNDHTDDNAFFRPDRVAFLSSPSDSIDYAVMERTDRAAVVPLALNWSDLGSWEAFYRVGPQDDSGNVCSGDVLTEGAANCYLNATHRLLAAVGVRDLIVVETQDSVMVAPRDQVQDVKKIVERLQNEQRPECKQHPLVHRPWGSYETLAAGGRFQVKRIIVRPGAELSLQMHHHRAEHWVVVSGTAEVTNGDEVELLTENQSTYIPVGTTHRLKNPGVIPLVLIEIQSGAYLGEDDIVRFSDEYGRGC